MWSKQHKTAETNLSNKNLQEQELLVLSGTYKA